MELALEGDRRWDLIRWGIYLQAMNALGGMDEANNVKQRSSKHLLFPIPTLEILTNQGVNENNPPRRPLIKDFIKDSFFSSISIPPNSLLNYKTSL